jgi:SIR2-like domain
LNYVNNSSFEFTDQNWKNLFHYINRKKTTPFLGAGISREHFGSGKELAKKIADEFDYPFFDISDLAKVSQFAVIKSDAVIVRDFVAEYIKNKGLPDFNNPSEPHRILAELELPIYITTNYDHLMYEALKFIGKDPIIEYCRWNDLAEIQGKASIFDNDDFNYDSSKPLVYHLHGEIDNSQSMVLTEDDYLSFIVNLSINIDKLFPARIRTAIASSSMIFIGYSLSDWNLRIIFRKIAQGIKSVVPNHCSIQLSPTDVKIEEEKIIKEYLKSYFQIIQGVNLNVFWGTAIDFCHMLSEKIKNHGMKQNVHTN